MKLSSSMLMLILIASWQTQSRYTGFESNVNRMITAYKILIEDVERGFSRLSFYFDNLEDYNTNDEFFTVSFTDSLNYTIENLEESKTAIYDSLETMVTEIYHINNRRSIYYKSLQDGYDEIVQYIATLDEKDIDMTLKDLFKEFVAKKNLFFYDISLLKTNIDSSVINLVNTFDMIETFIHDTMKVGDSYVSLTVNQVKTFYFISGFLSQMKEYYQIHNELLEEINKTFLSLEDTINDYDGYLESLKFYYYRRYVEGYTEDEINNFPQVLFSEKVEEDTEDEADDKKTENERDPVNVCDQVLLSNFGIKGHTIAVEVDEFEKIPHCPSIRNTCCPSDEISVLYAHYYNDKFNILLNKQKLVKGIINKVLSGYQNILDLAYYFLKSPRSSPTCRDLGRKVVFTPLSKDFAEKLDKYMTNANEFASRSRAAVMCLVCDYDFHKSLLEDNEIKLSREFCSSMMANYFDFINVYYLQLIDYFNNVIDLVQCEKDTGNLNQDVILQFSSNEKIESILADCAANRVYCEQFCQEFEFLNIESVLDVDIPTLRRFYNFLDFKLKENDLPMSGFIDSEYFTAAGLKYSLENNFIPSKSIDKLKKVFVQDVNDKTAHNLFSEGTDLLKALREQDFE